MKRLISSVLSLSMLLALSGCSEESENLQICGIEYGKQGDYFKPTLQDFINAPHVELADKYNNKIATFHNDRGIALFDFIMQKVDIKDKPSCYLVLDMFYFLSKTTVNLWILFHLQTLSKKIKGDNIYE